MSDPASSLVVALPFPKHVGITTSEHGVLNLADREGLHNHVGTLHAGALFTLGESASGVVMVRQLASALGGAMPIAKSATITYRRPARGSIRAVGSLVETVPDIVARLRRDGKTTFDIAVTMEDEAGVEVAVMTVSWYVRTAQPATPDGGGR